MEKDDDVKGNGNSYDFGARIYDPRVGIWFSTDALEAKYPNMSPYSFALNSPLIYIDIDGRDVIIVISKEFIEKYQSIFKKLTNSEVFNRIYTALDNSDEYFRIESFKSKVNFGEFRIAKDKGFFFIDKGGSKPNPHLVRLRSNTGESNKGRVIRDGFKSSTLFEEMFHAYQYLSDKYERNIIQVETEAKVAKVYAYYNLFGDESLDIGNIKEFGISTYESKLLLNIDTKNKKISFNAVVKEYFDVISTGGKVDEKLEKLYRRQVLLLSRRVRKVYSKHKIIHGESTSETPNFDKLVKEICPNDCSENKNNKKPKG